MVLDGTPLMLPTAQAMSDVGKRVKSAVEQEELLADAAVDVVVRDILVVVKVAWEGVSTYSYSRMSREYMPLIFWQANNGRVVVVNARSRFLFATVSCLWNGQSGQVSIVL